MRIGLEIRSCSVGENVTIRLCKNAKGLNLDDVKKVKKDLMSFSKQVLHKYESRLINTNSTNTDLCHIDMIR